MNPSPTDRESSMKLVVDTLGGIAPEVDTAALEPHAPLRAQVDLDSADWLEFLIRLHAATGVDIPDADARRLFTLMQVADYLADRVAGDDDPKGA
jgi:acyl carrier protein